MPISTETYPEIPDEHLKLTKKEKEKNICSQASRLENRRCFNFAKTMKYTCFCLKEFDCAVALCAMQSASFVISDLT
jgi:hypothetical protein